MYLAIFYCVCFMDELWEETFESPKSQHGLEIHIDLLDLWEENLRVACLNNDLIFLQTILVQHPKRSLSENIFVQIILNF